MSGGKLVVMDRIGREIKHYKLSEGLATLGSDPACDIRFLLPTVGPHHATVVVHSMQTVVQAVSLEHETLVNGLPVSVAALRHDDVIELGGRSLRWEYDDPGAERPLAPEPALRKRAARGRAARRASQPAPRDLLVHAHRASMPACSGGKQVAIVQPQRRDTSDFSDAASNAPRTEQPQPSGSSGYNINTVVINNDRSKRRPTGSPRSSLANLSNTTKATLWIESRKSSPRKSTKSRTPIKRSPPGGHANTAVTSANTRSKTPAKKSLGKSPRKSSTTPQKSPANITKTPVRSPARKYVRKTVSAKKSTPLRMTALKKAHSANKTRVTKIQAPLKMDSTKQAAIMLMAGHTPKSKQISPKQGIQRPSYVIKKSSPIKKTPKKSQTNLKDKKILRTTPKESSSYSQNDSSYSHKTSDNDQYASLIEITDTSPTVSDLSQRSRMNSLYSAFLSSPKKSALKDPSAKKSTRKTESIKFDLSNLENSTHSRSSDVMLINETVGTQINSDDSATNHTLRYSDSSTPKSLASTSSLNANGQEISLGLSTTEYPQFERSLTSESLKSKKSLRSIKILKEALCKSNASNDSYSRRITKSISAVSTRNTRNVTPRERSNNLESYSVVDLVSNDSNDSYSNYNSAGSVSSYASYETATLSSHLRDTSTPDFEIRENLARTRKRELQMRTAKSQSTTSDVTKADITTPENTEDSTKNITFNTNRISRAAKSRSRINESDHIAEVERKDSSPRSSKRIGIGSQQLDISTNRTSSDSPSRCVGTHTPENRLSPVEASTPVLSIQSLLDASQNSSKSQSLDRNNKVLKIKRKTIGGLRSSSKRSRIGLKSKSLNLDSSLKGRDISANFDRFYENEQNDEEVVTPKSAVKPIPEGVKNKHSTAKKPYSKRSLIDNLNESDIVKQLFNSPVKRKLSQSMTEFSRKQLVDDNDDGRTRVTRATIASCMTERTPEYSILDHTEAYTPDVFVSPLNTPNDSPDMNGIKRLFQQNTPDNDLRNVRGVKALLRTPRPRRSIRNDLTNVTGVKSIFAKSPKNSLSQVRIKEIFAMSPKNDLRRVSGVRALFQSKRNKGRSPRNELDDVRGVRNLFKQQSKSPKNDLTDVRGVKQLFKQGKQRNDLSDLSGVEKLFQDSSSHDSTFDRLIGRPPIRATYSKAKSFSANSFEKKNNRKSKSKSLYDSTSQNTTNIKEWLEKDLKSREHEDVASEESVSKGRKLTPNNSKNVSKMNLIRELQKLSTDTVDGVVPVIISRTRNSSIHKNEQADQSSRKKSASELYGAHTLPIKKRSLIESSINKSNNDRHTRSNKLPIKKRAVVHSTPVKGRVNITMNASEIGRISPISSEDKTTDIEKIGRHLPESEVSSKTNQSSGKNKPIMEIKNQSENTELVSKNQIMRKPPPTSDHRSPVPVRSRRVRKSINDNQEYLNVKKRRSSIVIIKKNPILSPKRRVTRNKKCNPGSEQPQIGAVSPRRTRLTRGQNSRIREEIKPLTPKNPRVIIRRSIVIVTKPSPKLKPQTTRPTTNREENSEQLRTKRKRKIAITEPNVKYLKKNSEFPDGSQVKALSSTGITNTQKVSVSQVQTRRSRKVVLNDSALTRKENKNNPVQSNRRRKLIKKATENSHDDTNDKKSTHSKVSTLVESKEFEKYKGTRLRGKKIESQVSVESQAVVESQKNVEPKRRGRRMKAEDIVVSEVMTTKGKGRRTVLEDLPPKRVARRQKGQKIPSGDNNTDNKVIEEIPPVVTGRGRKRKHTEQVNVTVSKDDLQMEITKTREKLLKKSGKATVIKNMKKGAGDANDKSTQEKKSAKTLDLARRTRNADQKNIEDKSLRERKQAATVAKSAPNNDNRKKRTNVDMSDTKDSKKQPAKKARTSERSTARSAPAAARSPARSAARSTTRSAALRAAAAGARGRR